ncbi:MAG: hypothetical protein ABSF23_06925 [Terracidiphilus sp.]
MPAPILFYCLFLGRAAHRGQIGTARVNPSVTIRVIILIGWPTKLFSGLLIARLPVNTRQILELPVSDMKMIRIFPLALILVGAVLLFEQPAYAYVDPGSGLLAIQAAGSALIATGWYLRRRIYTLLHRSEAVKQEHEVLRCAANREDMSNS